MSLRSRLPLCCWLLLLLGAGSWLGWVNVRRAERVNNVTHLDAQEARIDPASPTGYAGGKRWLIVPEHNNRSYQWIAETQQMFSRHEARVRHIDYENAPFGRDVHSASPYRWWLGLVAWADHAGSGRPLGLSVERAALWAGPLLHGLLLFVTAAYMCRRFGYVTGTWWVLGLTLFFPFAAGFLPGVPDDHSLARACIIGSVLPLLAAVLRGAPASTLTGQSLPDESSARALSLQRAFAWAGFFGGFGLWVSPGVQTPVLGGLALGGALASWINRHRPSEAGMRFPRLPWRIWALAGSATCLFAYLAEYFPHHLDFQPHVNHPVYGLAWIGLGELLLLFQRGVDEEKSSWGVRRLAHAAAAVAAIAALPVSFRFTGTPSPLAEDLLSSRLTSLPNGVVAKNLAFWIHRDGLSAAVVATCLPLLLLIPALGHLLRSHTRRPYRVASALALGPVLIALPLACRQLAWWQTCDALLLMLMIPFFMDQEMRRSRFGRAWLTTCVAGALICLLGWFPQFPRRANDDTPELTRLEAESLMERGLAHWIADHAPAPGAVVLLPPDRTTSWCFHGGLRGLGTANWENREGLAATIRIVTANTAEEAKARLDERGVTFLALPSWDTDLDEFARWSLRNPEDAFVMALHHWTLPPWLRPVPYRMPNAAGLEDRSISLFRVTDETNRAAAASRLAEYFVEMQRTEMTPASRQALQRYPADLSALVALAQVEEAAGDRPRFDQALGVIVAGLNAGLDRSLAWDRRVSLAIVLALGQRNDLAREQIRRCIDKLDEDRLLSLTTGSLYRLQVLAKAFALPIADPALRERAIALLPAELRARL